MIISLNYYCTEQRRALLGNGKITCQASTVYFIQKKIGKKNVYKPPTLFSRLKSPCTFLISYGKALRL